jgi:glycosyltransferase involved in cell wall biosynthesis
MPLKLGMDVRMIQHSGIGVRIQNILKYIRLSDGFEIYLFGNPNTLAKFSIPRNSIIIPYDAKIYSISEMFGHPKMKEMDYLDIPHFNVPLIYLSKCNVTIHDLIPWVMKEFHASIIKRIYLKFILSNIQKYSKKVITVSNHTKSDFIKYFGTPKNSIDTIYNGIDRNLYIPQSHKKILDFKKKYKLPRKYFLSVGIGKGHKNFDFMIQNFIELWKSKNLEQSLVLAGAYKFEIELLKELPEEFRNKVFTLPRIEDEEMPSMYQSAEALVYPSLYEGFGFPVIEAQAVGCPVISSKFSVLPEILRESAIYFDPQSDRDFQNKILEYCNFSESKKKNFIEMGRSNSNRFSWDSTLGKIQNYYYSLLY